VQLDEHLALLHVAKAGEVSAEEGLKGLQCVPLVERAYKLDEAAEALRHLIEDRPFGRVVLVG